MLCLCSFELYSRWVPPPNVRHCNYWKSVFFVLKLITYYQIIHELQLCSLTDVSVKVNHYQ